MVKGFLSTFGFVPMTPAPAVQGLVYIPRLRLGIGWVRFMVDTGASNTCLHGTVVLALQNRMRQSTLTYSRGVGGRGAYYKERAVVILVEENRNPLPFIIDLRIQCVEPEGLEQPPNPSLLGRDILQNFDLRVNLRTGLVRLNKIP